MKKIDLTVQAKYTVSLGEVEVSDEIYNKLVELYDEYNGEVDSNDFAHTEAMDFLTSKIKEQDAMDWGFEIFDMSDSDV